MVAVTLDFLAAQQERILAESAALRDDLRMMSAVFSMTEQNDGSAPMNRIRGWHAQSLDCVLNMF